MTGPRSSPPTLEGFTHIGWIGGGGFADVFKYEQSMLGGGGREVAVKVLWRALDGLALESFRAEANTMAKLSNHPSIVTIHQAGFSPDGRPFLAMEVCSSDHLGKRIAKRPFTVQKTLELGVQLCGAVVTAHSQGILHRDIKPANILFTEIGRPALTDFGIAVSVEAASGGEAVILSPLWAPPEQWEKGGARMGTWSDVYSLAATLWAVLVGHSPFELPGGDNDKVTIADRARRMDPPSIGRPDVPSSLERIFRVALAKRPEDRYRSAVEFGNALRAVQAELHLGDTPLEYLVQATDLDPEVVDTGTSLGGFVLIDPDDAPVTGTATHNTSRTAGDTQLSFSGSWGAHDGVLQHGRGVAAPREVDFTGPSPLPAPSTPTDVPAVAEFVESTPQQQRSRWGVVLGSFAAVVVIGVGGALAMNSLGGARQSSESPTPDDAAPADPIGALVPQPEDLVGVRDGEQVTFTWVNPDPRDGDFYSYWVQQLGEDRTTEITKETSVTVSAEDPKTCIEVELRRSTGRGSAPVTECVE